MGCGFGASPAEAEADAVKNLATYDWSWSRKRHGYDVGLSQAYGGAGGTGFGDAQAAGASSGGAGHRSGTNQAAGTVHHMFWLAGLGGTSAPVSIIVDGRPVGTLRQSVDVHLLGKKLAMRQRGPRCGGSPGLTIQLTPGPHTYAAFYKSTSTGTVQSGSFVSVAGQCGETRINALSLGAAPLK